MKDAQIAGATGVKDLVKRCREIWQWYESSQLGKEFGKGYEKKHVEELPVVQ